MGVKPSLKKRFTPTSILSPQGGGGSVSPMLHSAEGAARRVEYRCDMFENDERPTGDGYQGG